MKTLPATYRKNGYQFSVLKREAGMGKRQRMPFLADTVARFWPQRRKMYKVLKRGAKLNLGLKMRFIDRGRQARQHLRH